MYRYGVQEKQIATSIHFPPHFFYIIYTILLNQRYIHCTSEGKYVQRIFIPPSVFHARICSRQNAAARLYMLLFLFASFFSSNFLRVPSILLSCTFETETPIALKFMKRRRCSAVCICVFISIIRACLRGGGALFINRHYIGMPATSSHRIPRGERAAADEKGKVSRD